jgi:hypothetical protein
MRSLRPSADLCQAVNAAGMAFEFQLNSFAYTVRAKASKALIDKSAA